MKKTLSAPNLTALAGPQSTILPACNKGINGKLQHRSVSVNSLQSIDDVIPSYMNDIVMEFQMESVLHVPGIVKGQCSLSYSFPAHILNSNHDSLLDKDRDQMKDFATCLATPLEHEEARTGLRLIANSMSNNPEVVEKYARLLFGVRKNRRRRSTNTGSQGPQ